MKKSLYGITAVLVSLFMLSGSAIASGAMKGDSTGKNAIILASFGTTVPSAVSSIVNISNVVRKAYPATEVRLTFTSNMIRSVWKKTPGRA